jgi:hypothetical protein
MPTPPRWFALPLAAATAVAAVGAHPVAAPAQTAGQPAAGGAAVVAGTVRAQDGRPLAGATVAFQPSGAPAGAAGAPGAQTDAAGRFRLAVPAGAAGRLVVRRVQYSASEVAVGPSRPARGATWA